MKNMAQDLHIGDVIEVAGVAGKVRGISRNDNGLVLVLKIKGTKVPKTWGKKRAKAHRKSRMVVTVHRKTVLTVKT